MNAPSLPPFSSHEPPALQSGTPEDGPSQAPAPSERIRHPGFGPVRWIQQNTFAPQWLPEQLRDPLIGYLVAVLVELAAISLILLLLSAFPTFTFYEIFTLVGVVLLAVGWGAGPSLLATLLSTLLVWLVVLAPHFSWAITDPANGVGLVLYLVVGASISLLAGRSEWARRQAEWARRQAVETAHLLTQEEARSRSAAERLRTVLDVLPSAVLITSNQGQLLAMNQATKTLWGGDIAPSTDIIQFPQDKVWRTPTGQRLAPEEMPLARALSSGETVLNMELEIETLDGQRKPILNSVAPIQDATGAVTGAVISAQDISDLRRLEREVAERAQELEAIFETMTDGVFVYDVQGHITRVNAAGREILGPDALANDRPMQERAARRQPLDEQDRPLSFERLPSVRILRGEVLTGAQAVDVSFSSPNGHTRAFSASGTPLRTAEGALAGAVMVTRDVTERRQLEREVAEHAQELGAIFEAMTDGIAFLDAGGQLIRTNHAFRILHGVDQDPDFLHRPLHQRLATLALADEQGRPLAVDEWPATRLLQGEALAGVDVRVTTLQGREVVLNVGGAPIRDQEGQVTGCVEVFRDVTARHQLEQRTRESLDALMTMAEAMVQVRPATPADEGADAGVGDNATAPPVADTILPLVARRLAELTRATLECRCVSVAAVDTPTGLLHPVTEVGLPPEQEQAWWASWSPLQSVEERYGATIAASLYAGQPAGLALEHLPKRSWNTLYQVHTGHILPMRLGEELVGTLLLDYEEHDHAYSSAEEMLLTETLARLGALVLERDRLLRRWAEARANELALGETKTQMDTFLGIVSHELRTPLTSLKLSLQVAERRLRRLVQSKNAELPGRGDGLQPAVEQLSRTAHQVGRLERLVNDLVDISRIQANKLDLRLDLADLVVIVREVVEAQQQAESERTIRLLCPADLAVPVYVDAGRIEQVVTNFLTNALKYSRADHPVDVGVEVDPEEQQARVWVRDQGPGLPVEEQERIWERFHRANGVEVQSGAGVGLGLGLYISRMIVERHHGQVGIESAADQGSTFWFTLPLNSSTSDLA